jgi:CDP-2,3-bis-(O-geranylgeranyl)-sn-glycerol synthase
MIEIQPFLVAQILVLLTLANGTPVIAKKVLGSRLAHPLDFGMVAGDGRPLLGGSKTIRGVVLSMLLTALCAPLIGLEWGVGLLVSATAMTGDVLSSFAKRRMRLESGSMVLGLDHIPESLLPAIACRLLLPITVADMVCVTALFSVGALAVSVVLYKLGIRDRPY